MSRSRLFLLLTLLLLIPAQAAYGQTGQCETVDTISYPIDTNVFQIVQDYAAASPRHQGRFHTGEDWHMVGGTNTGQPVRAAANGRVTYSSPRGWGRDGGVIIIEHTLPDGEIFYTQYGHIAESDSVIFPLRLSCVEAGDIIAVIGDARPAPHLHFEVRVNQPDVPGPGYTRETPDEEGWRRPAKVLASVQTQLHRAYLWHVDLREYGPQNTPLLLNDNSLMIIDGTLLRRITQDGRVLWRVALQRPAVGITGYQANPLLIFRDGTINPVDYEGNQSEGWQVDFAPVNRLPDLDGSLMFYTQDRALVTLSEDLREIRWRLENVPTIESVYISGELIALLLEDQRLWLVSHDGVLVDESVVENGADMSTLPDGTLLIYTEGGLWQIDSSGTWSEAIPDAPSGGGSSAVAATSDGRIYLMDGSNLYAYTAERTPAWQASLPFAIRGDATMQHDDHVLLITSTYGDVVTLRDSGGICGFANVYGDDLANEWHDLGEDGTLRIALADQIIGFNWERLTNGC